MKKHIALFALIVAAVWLVATIYKNVEYMSMNDLKDPFWYGYFLFPLFMTILSMRFLRKGGGWSPLKKNLSIGGLLGGSIPILLGALHVGMIAITRFSQLSDGTYWWAVLLFTNIVEGFPALLIGGGIGALIGWKFGKPAPAQ